MLGLLIRPHLFYVVSTCWQAWSFLELIPTWFISCWKFGTHILTLLCAVVTIAEVASLRRHQVWLSWHRNICLSPWTILRNLLLMLLLWYLFLLLFEIQCSVLCDCVNLTLLLIYIVLHLDLVVLVLLSIWSRKACCPVLVGITSKIKLHVWYLMMNLLCFCILRLHLSCLAVVVTAWHRQPEFLALDEYQV